MSPLSKNVFFGGKREKTEDWKRKKQYAKTDHIAVLKGMWPPPAQKKLHRKRLLLEKFYL